MYFAHKTPLGTLNTAFRHKEPFQNCDMFFLFAYYFIIDYSTGKSRVVHIRNILHNEFIPMSIICYLFKQLSIPFCEGLRVWLQLPNHFFVNCSHKTILTCRYEIMHFGILKTLNDLFNKFSHLTSPNLLHFRP